MRCLACGGELKLVQVAEDEAKMTAGYEQHTFECSSCHGVERRPVFNESKKPIRRLVQIVQHPKYEGSFAAQEYEIWRDYFGSSGPRMLARTM